MNVQHYVIGVLSALSFHLWMLSGIESPAYGRNSVTLMDQARTIEIDQRKVSSTSLKDLTVDQALEKLRTADRSMRRTIIQTLKQQGAVNIPRLIDALGESDPLVKSAAAEILGSFGETSEPAIAALVQMLDDQRSWNAPASGYSLIPSTSILPAAQPIRLRVPPPALNAPPRRRIPKAPRNPDYALKISAAAALGQIGGKARIQATPKLALLLTSSDPWTQLNAGWALMHVGADHAVLPTFTQLLAHPDLAVRAEASALFGRYEGLIHKILGAESTPETTAAIVMALNSPDASQRYHLRTALATIGADAIAPLTAALSHPSPFLRLEAAKALGEQEYKAIAAIPRLLELLEDSTQAVSTPRRSLTLPSYLSPPQLTARWSSQSLSGRGFAYYEKPTNSEQVVKIEAIYALTNIIGQESSNPEVTAALYESLSDPMAGMRLAAAWSILSSEQHRLSPQNRRRVMNTIIAIAPPTDRLETLRPTLDSHQALRLLKSIGQPAASYLLPYYETQLKSPEQNHRIQTIIALGRLGSSALPIVPRLRDQYLSSNTIYQGYSATILGEIAMDLERQSNLGTLSYPQRLKAIREFEQVLAVMESPRHRFNQQPVDRVRRSLQVLQATMTSVPVGES